MSGVTTKYVTQDGDVVKWKVKVENTSTGPCQENRVVFTIPTGILLTGPSTGGLPEILVSKGSYDRTTDTWWIGELIGGESTETEFEFTIDDITQADPLNGYFIVEAQMSSLCVEDTADNKSELVIQTTAECEDGDLSIGSGEDVDVNISIG